MSELRDLLDGVRRAWRRTELIKGAVLLLADAIVVLIALVVLDALYHFPPAVRGLLLVLGLTVLATAAAISLLPPLRRRISDEEVALHAEARYPDLKGRLLSAVEFEDREAESEEQAALFDALIADGLSRAVIIDHRDLVDRRRLARRALIAGALLLLSMIGTAVNPAFVRHQLARVLAPWQVIPMTSSEVEADRKRTEIAARQRELENQAAQASTQAAAALTVKPGDVEIGRGESVHLIITASRVTGPVGLRFKASDGSWKDLPLAETPDDPRTFQRDLTDIAETMQYQAVMEGVASPIHTVTVYDRGALKEFKVTLHYPAYTAMPDRVITGKGDFEAPVDSQAEVSIATSAPLKSGSIEVTGAPVIAMKVNGHDATGTIPVTANGRYTLAAIDAHGETVKGLETSWAIRAIKDQPPTLDVVYPGIDTIVHPMEEIAFAANAADDVGIKEVRLVSFYNEEPPVIQRHAVPAGKRTTRMLAEFTIDLAARKAVAVADTIVFHFEVEDLKGQLATSDVYALTVRGLESFCVYSASNETGATHAPEPPEMITLINAAHNLQGRKPAMSPEEWKKECAKIARWLEDHR